MIDALSTPAVLPATLPGALTEPVAGDAAPGFAALLAAELPSTATATATATATVALAANSTRETPLAMAPAPSLRPGRLFLLGQATPIMLQPPGAAASRPTRLPVFRACQAMTGLLPEPVSVTLMQPADDSLAVGVPVSDNAGTAAQLVIIPDTPAAGPTQLQSVTDDLPSVLRTDDAASAGHALHHTAPLAVRNPLLPVQLRRVAPAMLQPLAAVMPTQTAANAAIRAKNTVQPEAAPQPGQGASPPAVSTTAPTAPPIAAAPTVAERMSTLVDEPKVALAAAEAASTDDRARDEPGIGDGSLLPANAVAVAVLDPARRLLMLPGNTPVSLQTAANAARPHSGGPPAVRGPAYSAVGPGLAVGQPAPGGRGVASPSMRNDVLAAVMPAAATLPARISPASSSVMLPAVPVAAADGTAAALVSVLPLSLPPVFALPVATAAGEASDGAPAPGATPTPGDAVARTRQPLQNRDTLRLESEATAAPQGFVAPFASAATLPRSLAALPSGLHPIVTPPPQPLVISSETLGAVTVGLDGGPQDLRLRLDAGPLAAGLLVAEAPRLIADLAAQGVRLHALDIGGQTLNPALMPSSSSAPGTGFGQQPQGQQPQGQHQHRSPLAMPTPALRPDTGALVPPPVSDRYA